MSGASAQKTVTVHSFTEYILKHKEVEDLEKRIAAIEERLRAEK